MTFSRFLVATAIAGLATAAAVAQGGGGMFRTTDTNGDGMISHVEATAEANARFTAMDLNKDGFLTPDEMSGPGARMMTRADSDGDGKVSRAEFLAQADMRFARIDANKDGQISREELTAWMDRAHRDAGRPLT
uniref:EF-hand domain-containing protein n=1 Tax=uncultured Sphingomonas sp. TaxID=158754 RepID=UPI0035C96358